MPSIETKSREERIEEMNKTEKKEVTTRNRRMFSNLLQGTLTRFQRDEKKIQNVEKIQAEKQLEVEKRLEDKKREDREKIMAERQKLFDERREQERELRALQRKKALMQYAEAKKEHYKLLRNFIQTQTKPTLFFVPAKHSLRSLELLKASEKAIDGLMELRQKELERELENGVDEDRDREHNTSGANDAEVGQSKEVSEKRRRDRSFSRSGDEDDNEKSPDAADPKEKSAEPEGFPRTTTTTRWARRRGSSPTRSRWRRTTTRAREGELLSRLTVLTGSAYLPGYWWSRRGAPVSAGLSTPLYSSVLP